MNENFLHYIWKFQLFDKKDLHTSAGENLSILKNGEHNTDAGPDFFNAKIKIGKTIWAGNIEIHLKSSDWRNHAHQKDKSYDNVILHIVYEEDVVVKRKDGSIIPCLELKRKIDEKIHFNYEQLMQSKQWIPCENLINSVNEFTLKNWTDRLLIERLERKTKDIKEVLSQNKNNWEETFYQFLSRNFGLKINAEPFEQLAKSLPIKVLAKHKNNLLQIESLLFGQAGMLENPHPASPPPPLQRRGEKEEGEKFKDEYPNQLKKEYLFLKQKYSLSPIIASSWKFLRLMPANFPTIRLAQFAQLIFHSSHLFSKILEAKHIGELEKCFEISVTSYWQTHYLFDKISVKREKHFGKTAIQTLIINTIVPFLFVYGKMKGNNELKERALLFLEKIPSEKNSIITKWETLHVHSDSAYQTQTLLELKNNYCDSKQCLNCAIGNRILRN